MRSLSDAVGTLRRCRAAPAAMRALLFPGLAGPPNPSGTAGLLRAPRRGRRAPPLLSACDPEAVAGLLAERGWEEPRLLARAAAARQALVAARVGGDWWHDPGERLPEAGFTLIALAEPGFGNGRPDETVLAAMLAAALAENAARRLVVLAPARPGHALGERIRAARAAGALVIDRPCDPWPLLDRAGCVYSPGGETGFLALLAGVPVRAFAAGWCTGWGVTADAPGVRQQPFHRSLDEIFAGVCLLATRYRDPFRDAAAPAEAAPTEAAPFEDVLAILADWRRVDEANRRIAVCVGMSFWKRRRIADFVCSSAGESAFRRSAAAALAIARARPGAIAGWASRLPTGLAEAAAAQGTALIRVEDGFIRSVGLGSDFLPPASVVLDGRGMYFDPRGGSDLEALLRDGDFPPAMLARAGRLREWLVARGVTKYNLSGGAVATDLPAGRRILVPGQVEDDLSIRFGAGAVRTNLELLRAVRQANPDAVVLYKPHPDVLAGHRIGAVPEAEARRFADRVVAGGSTDALLAQVDELHTMTSLAGFEALLRGRRVVVYGRPFYAGWGLTVDIVPFDRGRRLTVDELVAGALILYPRYLDPVTRLPCGPEILIERLDRPELWRPGPLMLARRLQGIAARRIAELRARLPRARVERRAPASRRLGERPRA